MKSRVSSVGGGESVRKVILMPHGTVTVVPVVSDQLNL
jgi:hypothetical protein